MELWKTTDELIKAGQGSFTITKGKLTVTDQNRFRAEAIDKLIRNAIFAENEAVKNLTRWVIWEGAQELGCPAASIHDFYMARAGDGWRDMTTPAINIRALTYDTARTIFKTLHRLDAAAGVFEIAKSEVTYTMQRPSEYATSILAAALREGHRGPVFVQGDHFQANAKNYTADPKKEVEGLKKLISEAVEAGFYNIDVDSSTLVDLTKPTIMEQQRANFDVAAELTRYIRSVEPKGVTISVGAEIGEVGGKNSTVEELVAFMEGYNRALNQVGKTIGISKISIQTGTAHGGVVLPDGSIAKVKLDLDALKKLGEVARTQFKIGGAVQHGASTLPESAFGSFAKCQAVEVHLATAFQNILYDSTAFPTKLREQIYAWLEKNCADERKGDMTAEQFYYKTRKKGFGPFKRELWSLPDNTKGALLAELARSFETIFTGLGIKGSRPAVEKFSKPTAVHKPCPLS